MHLAYHTSTILQNHSNAITKSEMHKQVHWHEPPNKGILDESREKSKVEAIVPAKSDQQVHNLRNKRAEMERYISKPAFKLPSQEATNIS